ncbi:MAG: Gfo/Idh/MocA family oxidoreductase [Lentimicrobiaceae bacterium]|jgi:predicted dehydrogenase
MQKKDSKSASYAPLLNVGIVGFGLSGQVFHAPFIDVNPNFDLHTILTTGTLASEKYPLANITSSYEELLANPEIDLVIICSPNSFHFSHASAALLAGKHVIVEKPFAVNSTEAKSLIEIANKSGKYVFPFHNRRWDSDFLTVKHIIAQGLLGKVVDYESRFDRFTPEILRAFWKYQQKEGGGTLFDLGIHLIDQAVSLFGAPEGVFARLFNQREGSVTDDSFDLKLVYPDLNVTLKASVFVKEPGPRFQVHGTKGSFVKYGLDSQEAQLKQNIKPGTKGFGIEPASQRGILNTGLLGKEFRGRYKTFPGDYMEFFNNVYSVIVDGAEMAIKPEEALLNIRIIEAAKKSHKEQAIIPL